MTYCWFGKVLNTVSYETSREMCCSTQALVCAGLAKERTDALQFVFKRSAFRTAIVKCYWERSGSKFDTS
jgi:hypothetical protein